MDAYSNGLHAPAYTRRVEVKPSKWRHGSDLKAVRESAGLSVEKAAGRIGYTRATWHKWEKEQQDPGQDALKAIVEAFHCPPEAIGYTPPRGWELVPSEWIRQAFEQQNTLLRTIAVAVGVPSDRLPQ